MSESEITESKKEETNDALNKKIEYMKRRMEHMEKCGEFTKKNYAKFMQDRDIAQSKYRSAVSSFRNELKRCKLLTRNIKNIRLEYEHENSREFSTKLIMLLEHYKDEVQDEMNKEKNDEILYSLKSLYSF